MKKMVPAMAMATTLVFALMGCTTEPSKDPTRLEFVYTGKANLAIGETSPLWQVSKTFLDATGRTVTTSPYTSFTLTSSDTTVAVILSHQQVLGKAVGTTMIKASDDNKPDLITETSAKVTIVAAP